MFNASYVHSGLCLYGDNQKIRVATCHVVWSWTHTLSSKWPLPEQGMACCNTMRSLLTYHVFLFSYTTARVTCVTRWFRCSMFPPSRLHRLSKKKRKQPVFILHDTNIPQHKKSFNSDAFSNIIISFWMWEQKIFQAGQPIEPSLPKKSRKNPEVSWYSPTGIHPLDHYYNYKS